MSDTTTSNTNLQETRKKEIPSIIEKYKFLIDEIFKEVAREIPTFVAITVPSDDEEKPYKITAEEQLYNYLLMREKMIDHADKMLNKINVLELELYAPELFKKVNQSEPGSDSQDNEVKKTPRKNYAKRAAAKKSE